MFPVFGSLCSPLASSLPAAGCICKDVCLLGKMELCSASVFQLCERYLLGVPAD
jgi:hypothetical protein